jgi:CheY-like chemotaxis protein
MPRSGYYFVDTLRGAHVFAVHSHPEFRTLIVTILEYCGALVTAVGGAREALEAMKRVKPDVIVTDLVMPGEDGHWLLRAVRSLKPEDGGVVPVIAVREAAAGEVADAGAGFAGVLAKPVSPWELCGLITRLVLPA